MIDIIKPRRRKVVSYTLLPEEIAALAALARERGISKSHLVSQAIQRLPGYKEALQAKEPHDKTTTKPTKYQKRLARIHQDGFIREA